MKVTLLPFDQEYATCRFQDMHPGSDYKVDRGMQDITADTLLDFNHFEYLHALANAHPDETLGVLEGGCGYGMALADLKKGITFVESDDVINFMGACEVALARQVNERLEAAYRKKLEMIGKRYEGLGNRIRTTGVTLSEGHARKAMEIEEAYRPDEIIVGPIEACGFAGRFDFVYDFNGPAMHFPEVAIPAYGRALKPGRLGLMRLDTAKQRRAGCDFFEFLYRNNLSLCDYFGSLVMDVLFRKMGI